MAPNEHLSWRRIDKFGGLWDTKPATLMPAEAAQVMSGCHPQPAGGLRAFFRPRPFGTTDGLARAGAALRVVGIYPTEGQAFCITAPVDTGVVTDAVRPPSGEAKAYVTSRASRTWGAAVTGIGAGITVSGLLFPTMAQAGGVLTPEQSDGRVYTAIPQLSSSKGVYSMSEADDAFTLEAFVTATKFAYMAEHQNRLIGAYESSIVFTTPGTADFPTTGSFPDKFINFGGRPVAWILPLPPNDLLVGLADGAIFNVQGPLDDPTIRTVKVSGSGNYGGIGNLVSGAVLSEYGAVAVAPTGPYLVSPDGGMRHLARQLSDDHFTLMRRSGGSEGGMTVAASNQYLFVRSDGLYQQELDRRLRFLTTGDPYGVLIATAFEGAEVWPTDLATWVADNELAVNGLLTYDFETAAWFRSAHPDCADWKMPWHVTYNPGQEGFYEEGSIVGLPTEEITGSPATRLGYGHNTFGPRAHTWEWKSAPFRTDSGRQTRLREVKLGALGHTVQGVTSGPSTILVTAENEHGETDTFTVTVQPGSHVYTAPLRMDGTYVTVSLKAVSSDGVFVEAPTLEFIAFGFAEGKTERQK